MDSALKQRLVGAAVLVALGVIFIPMLLERGGEDARLSVQMDIPPPPDTRFENRLERASPPGEIEPLPALENPPESAPEPTPAPQKPASGAKAKPEAGNRGAGPARETDKSTNEAAAAGEEGRWIVQVGSFSREVNARVLRGKLNSAGFKASVETAQAGTGPVYRVRLEPVDKRGEAEAQVKRLAEKGGYRAIVLSHAGD